MPINLHKLHRKILSVIEKAEKVLVDSFGQAHQVSEKEGVASQAAEVTDVDEKIDALFHQELSLLFPEYGFITEEGKQEKLKKYNWIIDPIDGTTNYRHGFPFFGISIALWQDNEPLYGCISLPILKHRMYAVKDGGVIIDGKKLSADHSVIKTKPMVLLAPVAKPADHGKITEIIGETLSAPRDFGCCVYQGFETIAGKADVDVMYKLSLWDIGAIVLLADEAGLAVEYVSAKPDLAKENPKAYTHTVIIGKTQFVKKLTKVFKHLI